MYKKGVQNGRWIVLAPGHSSNYYWDDPMEKHVLLVRTGSNVLCPAQTADCDHDIENVSVNVDKIGDHGVLGKEYPLHLVVDSEGPTKVFKIHPPDWTLISELSYCVTFAEKQLFVTEALINAVASTQTLLRGASILNRDIDQSDNVSSHPESFDARLRDGVGRLAAFQSRLMEAFASGDNLGGGLGSGSSGTNMQLNSTTILSTLNSYQPFQSMLGPTITRKHQLLMDVIEARDLSATGYIGEARDVFCKAYLMVSSSGKDDLQNWWDIDKDNSPMINIDLRE